MAFPTEVDRIAAGGSASATEDHDVLMPTPIAAGDLLLAFIASESGGGDVDYSDGIPAGWSLIAQGRNTSNNANAILFAKIADGTEDGTTVTFSTPHDPGGHRYQSQSANISTWFGSLAAGLATALDVTGGLPGTNDPPNLAPSFAVDAVDVLWYAFKARQDVNSSDTISYPASYSDGLYSSNGGGITTKCSCATAWRQLAASAEDPSAFGGTGGVTMTIAIRPAETRAIKGLAYDPIEGALYILRGAT